MDKETFYGQGIVSHRFFRDALNLCKDVEGSPFSLLGHQLVVTEATLKTKKTITWKIMKLCHKRL